MTSVEARLAAALADRYNIVREIGAGGMATVYLARDIKHERNVALKVLKPELGAILGVERFLAEIRVTANLQHPNLLPLFDSGEADGLLFYVMPFVEGETLRAKLDREKQLPIEEAVHIATAVASALDYAHKAGVIHRDLKPENILIQSGQPVIADFGIALAVSRAGGQRVTESGLSLGTPQYMSPEQATADRAIDARSDIYSLGAVTYEMLTGEPPHTGTTAQAIISRIMTEVPRPVRASRSSVPAHVEQAVMHALEKLPADRFAAAQGFADALSGRVSIATNMSALATGQRARITLSDRSWRATALRAVPWGIAAASVVVAAIALTTRPAFPVSGVVTRTNLDLPGLHLPLVAGFAIAADGATVAVVAIDSTLRGRIYVRRSDELEARALAGTEGARGLAFSPDGRSLAFVRGDSLIRVPSVGGPLLVVARAEGVGNPRWASDGEIMFHARGNLYRVSGGGGEPKLLLARQADTSYLAPVPLPGGNAVLFFANYASDVDIRVLDLRSGRVRILIPRGMNPRYVESGHLLYTGNLNYTDRTILAVPFNIARMEVTGEPVPVLQGAAGFDVSSNGALVYRADGSGVARLFIVKGGGPAEPLSLPGGVLRSVRLAPDARRVVYGMNSGIYVHDLALGTNKRMIPADWRGFDPFWSLDGKRIAFHASRPSTLGFDGFTTAADSASAPKQLFRDSAVVAPQAWLSDGRMLARSQLAVPGGSDIVVLSFKGAPVTVTPYLNANWDEAEVAISPDEHWVAFRSNESGRMEVYVRPFPDARGGKWQLSERGGIDPVWARDGRSVYWWEGSTFRVAHLRTQPAFAVLSRETLLTDDAYTPDCCFPNYDVFPDGNRFIMARREGAREDGLVLVVNWFEELKARMGANVAKNP